MVQEAIQQCSRQRGILGKGRIPLAKRQVAISYLELGLVLVCAGALQ